MDDVQEDQNLNADISGEHESAPTVEAAPTQAVAPDAKQIELDINRVEVVKIEAPKRAAQAPAEQPKPEQQKGNREQGRGREGRPPREGNRPAGNREGGNREGGNREAASGNREGQGRDPNRGGNREGRAGGPDRDRRGGREGGRPGGGGRPFETMADIDLDKLVNDSLYLDNQAHAVVARLHDLDSATKTQLRRLYGAVRRAVRAPESGRQHEFVMLRARLAYTIARHSLRSLDGLERLLLQVTRKNEARGYERFRDLFEAIVAYNE